MTWWLLPLVLACTSNPKPWDRPIPERPEAFVDPGLRETGAGPVHALYRMPGRFQLPASTLPEGFTPTSRFPVTVEPEPVTDRKVTTVYRADSPFTSSVKARVTAPPGMKLYVGDEELPFHPSLRGASWMFRDDGGLLVAYAGALPEGGVSVTWEAARQELERREFGTAGLVPDDFVRQTVTVGRRTRPGLMIPAPGHGEWTLDIPPGGATFETWVSIAPVSLASLASDGAGVALQIVDGERVEDIDRLFVAGAPDWKRWTVDLTRFGGRTVTLRLATDPYESPDFDHVFLGAPTVWGPPSGDVRRVIVIGLDTTRPDHMGFYGYGRDTTPELDAIARTSTVFVNAWTPAPRTRPSFRSATTGRRPLEAVGATNIAELFQREGFATAGIVANVHLQPRFGFDRGFEDWWFDGQSKADAQVDRALAFLNRNAERDTFLFLHVMDPHLFYNAPAGYEDAWVAEPDPDLPRQFNRWEVIQWESTGALDDRRKKHIVALYDAEMKFMSEHLGRLFDKLDRMPGRSLVVVHNDHGEEFWEHGGFEHNHTLYDDVTRALLWFRSGPGQAAGAKPAQAATLADIAPTLFDLAGFDDLPPTDGRSLAPALLGQDLADRAIDLGHLRYGTERWGVVLDGHKYVLHTGSGDEELYLLADDPAERVDLAKRTPLTRFRQALAEAHEMPVGRGWRVRTHLRPAGDPFTIRLPRPALHAAIIDPEATTAKPVNQAWGEVPPRTPADVGTVTLDEARTTLTYTPGPKAFEALFVVLFGEEDVPPAGVVVERSGEATPLPETPGVIRWVRGPDSLTFEPGTVLVPPPGEAVRMRALSGAGSDREELCALGYIDCDDGH